MLIKLKCEHCNKPINRADRCIKHTDTDEIFCSVDCAQEDNKKYLKEEAAEANDLIANVWPPDSEVSSRRLPDDSGRSPRPALVSDAKLPRGAILIPLDYAAMIEEADEYEDEEEKRRIAIYGDSLL